MAERLKLGTKLVEIPLRSELANFASALATLRDNDGAVLVWQVSDVELFERATRCGAVLYDADTDCYVHPLASRRTDDGASYYYTMA